jgi:osmoprotectant transport system permease protein
VLARAPASLIGDTWSWLTSSSNWKGTSSLPGIPHLVVQHLQVTGASLGAAALVALPLGLVFGHLRRGGALVTVLGNLARAVPTLGLLVVLTSSSAFGFSFTTEVVALGVFAVPPLLTNTFTGMTEVDAETVDAARGMGMTPWQVLTRVELPLALPLIAAGVRTATLQVIATATVAAFVGGGGLGLIINFGNGVNDQGEVLAGAVLVAVLALVAELILSRVQALLTPGPRRARRVLPGSAAPVADGAASVTAG